MGKYSVTIIVIIIILIMICIIVIPETKKEKSKSNIKGVRRIYPYILAGAAVIATAFLGEFFGIFSRVSGWSDTVERAIREELKGEDETASENISNIAIEYLKEGNYEMAVKNFQKLNNDYLEKEEIKEQYKTAQSKYKEELFLLIDNLVKEQNYTSAYAMLDSARELLANDKEIQAKISEVKMQEVQKNAEQYIAEGNYKSAIIYLKDKISEGIQNETIIQIFNSAKENYIDEVCKLANQYIADENYDLAEEILLEAENILGERHPKIIEILGIIELQKPVALIGNIQARPFGTWLDLDVKNNYQDIFGYTYEGKSLSGDKATWIDPFTFGNQYFINGKYKVLRADITILDECESGSVKFYNSDEQIAQYEFDIAIDKPYEISVDIENVNLLGIRIEGLVLANIMLYVE